MHDIHCHMLPDLDDGPQTMEESLEMARLAVADGIQTVIMTPHGAQVAARGGREALAQRVREFGEALKSQHVELKLAMGMEYLLTIDLVREAQQGSTVTLNGSRYLLVEIDFVQWPPYTADALFQLQLAGYIPVLAHPERQASIQASPELLEKLVERGSYSEVTAGSLLGDFGARAQECAEELVRRGLVHFMASDGHTPTRNRPPLMAQARDALAMLAGEGAALAMSVGNPLAVLTNAPVEAPPLARPIRRRRFPWAGRG
ncbi:MAG: capsular biosynthesis protein [Chloroflexi bacterium]|nr:capsular biosynthesis protein [Chloroflexota bacterium]